jgi:hypothetical protein
MDKLRNNSSSILRALLPRTGTLLTHLVAWEPNWEHRSGYVESDIAEALICTLQLAYVDDEKGLPRPRN